MYILPSVEDGIFLPFKGEKKHIMSISAPEEIAYRFHWIDKEQLKESAEKYGKSPYGEHLRAVMEDRIVV